MTGASHASPSAVACPYGRASLVFPLSVSSSTALGLLSAAEREEAWRADVVGYTTSLTTEAGACSVRLVVPAPEAAGLEPGNYAAVLQAEGHDGWLPGLVNTCHGMDGGALGLEVVVLARPDARMAALMYLPEEVLRWLLPCRPGGARVRVLKPLLMTQLADCPGQWLRDRLLHLVDMLEGKFVGTRSSSGTLDETLAAAGLRFCVDEPGGSASAPVGPADAGARISNAELGYWTEEMEHGKRCAGSMDGAVRQDIPDDILNAML